MVEITTCTQRVRGRVGDMSNFDAPPFKGLTHCSLQKAAAWPVI